MKFYQEKILKKNGEIIALRYGLVEVSERCKVILYQEFILLEEEM
jgi:hypothetical protein